MNTYKRLTVGWGAWIQGGAEVGEVVTVVTKNGEKHERTVAGIVTKYKSGCVVSLVPDAAVAQKANERFAEKKAEFAEEKAKRYAKNGWTPSRRYTANVSTGSEICSKCESYCYGDCGSN